jgi:hypothetical protein
MSYEILMRNRNRRAIRQTRRLWAKTCYERFDFRRDLCFADELNRFIVQHELASKPLPARPKFKFIRAKAFAVEGQAHAGIIAILRCRFAFASDFT